MAGVLNHPCLELAAEDQHQGSQRQRKEHDGHQQQGALPPLPEAPIVARLPVGAAKAIH
jgi:hypothetical protein